MQRYAAAVGEFEVEIMNRPEIDPRFVAVVAHQVRASLCYARTGEAVAVVAFFSSCAATRRGAPAKKAAGQCLVPPGRPRGRAPPGIGRGAWWGRGEISGGAGSFKKKKKKTVKMEAEAEKDNLVKFGKEEK